MSVTVGVLRERAPGERRVAMVPRAMDLLAKSGVSYVLERGAGVEAGFPDMEYEAKGVRVLDTPEAVLAASDVVATVRVDAAAACDARHTVIGFCDPLSLPVEAQSVARR
ncbi:MAG: NAD(P)(+) transhydrogenase (Re/Si-specific) subunit alpha, partial [Bryobacter sp.]|nr:NAD(P)(+) transhydrogenase (Re/Si-specific) subunit alpha [Bryobacter sp.]